MIACRVVLLLLQHGAHLKALRGCAESAPTSMTWVAPKQELS